MTSHSCVTYTPLAVSAIQRFFNVKIKIPDHSSTEMQLKELSEEEQKEVIRTELPHLKQLPLEFDI